MKQCASLAKLPPSLEHTGTTPLIKHKGEVAHVPGGEVHGVGALGHVLKLQPQQPKQRPASVNRAAPSNSEACREPSEQGQGQVRSWS